MDEDWREPLRRHCTEVWRCNTCKALAASNDGGGWAYDDEMAAHWLDVHLSRSPSCRKVA